MDWDSLLAIDPQEVASRLCGFIAGEMERSGYRRLVVGLSGGLDSATACTLAARAAGPGGVTALILPYRSTGRASILDAEELAARLGVRTHTVEITPLVDAYFQRFPDAERIRRGNFMARQRMAVLYDFAARLEALVLGTGNKTESLLGYTTVYGDNACSLSPLGDLLKTQVWQLARHLQIPEPILAKPPTAELWEGQTDEGELGLTYETADRILHCLSVERLAPPALSRPPYDLPPEAVETVVRLIRRNRFKRLPPPVARITAGPCEPDV